MYTQFLRSFRWSFLSSTSRCQMQLRLAADSSKPPSGVDKAAEEAKKAAAKKAEEAKKAGEKAAADAKKTGDKAAADAKKAGEQAKADASKAAEKAKADAAKAGEKVKADAAKAGEKVKADAAKAGEKVKADASKAGQKAAGEAAKAGAAVQAAKGAAAAAPPAGAPGATPPAGAPGATPPAGAPGATPPAGAPPAGAPPAGAPPADAAAGAKPAGQPATGPRTVRAKSMNEPPKDIITNGKSRFGPLHDCDRIFQNLYGRHDWRLKGACQRGDWYRTADLLDMGPDWTMEQVRKSGLRGRGGAGFFCGVKWEFLRSTPKGKSSKVLIINCAEGEPGTCKDREIIRHEPHKILEGCLLGGYAMGCEKAIVYVRNRFYNEACNLQFALAEAYRYGLLGANSCDTGIKFDIQIQRGDRYICGEETALIACLEGKMGRPRRRPPFLTQKGYFDHPCLVINTESLAVLPTILRRGPQWFASLGRSFNSGTKLFNISGQVNDPCTVEEEMSIPLRDLIEIHAGGVKGGWDNVLAIFPGGLSTRILCKGVAEEVIMDFDCLSSAGSELGSAAVIVMNKQCDPLMAMQRSIEFYKKQTCKQCTPCRDGSEWLSGILARFTKGEAHPDEVDFLCTITDTMRGTTICALSDGQVNVIDGLIANFRSHIEDRIKEYGGDC